MATLTLSGLRPDPRGISYGFARMHWAPRIGRALLYFGHSHNPVNDNSIVAYDPVRNTHAYLWPKETHPSVGLQNRDNFPSFCIPTLGAAGELLVAGGSGLEAYPSMVGTEAFRSGRFDLASRTWIQKSTDYAWGWSGAIANPTALPLNSAMAWCEGADCGLSVGGAMQGNPVDGCWIVERNPAGVPPYRMVAFPGPRPGPRAQAHQLADADESGVWVYGGAITGFENTLRDLWRFDFAARRWTRYADGGPGGYACTVTYHADVRALFVWSGQGSAWAYWRDAGLWERLATITPASFNVCGCYCPPTGTTVLFGGNRPDGAGAYLAQAARIVAAPTTVPRPTIGAIARAA